jgi:peptide/nickel transport system substrate-binding protein
MRMGRIPLRMAAAAAALLIWLGAGAALVQKSGGILKVPDFASPASMSIHEEITRAAINALMHKAQNTIDTIVPDLAESWSWDAAKTALTLKLRHGVKWHDGEPFTAADVKCTWDLLQGKATEKFRLNPRKSWYRNLDEVTTNGDDEVTFHLKRPQPYLLVLLASGVSPVYPCHVSPAQMRQHPIGTGPFKFVEYKPNETIRLTRNTDYWKPDRPYLDGLEFPIVASVATRNLMFVAGDVDMTLSYGVSMPLLHDIKSQVDDAICEVTIDNGARNCHQPGQAAVR